MFNQNHIELSLNFDHGGGASGGAGSNGGGNAPLLFDAVNQVGEFEDGEAGELVNYCLFVVSHDGYSLKSGECFRVGIWFSVLSYQKKQQFFGDNPRLKS